GWAITRQPRACSKPRFHGGNAADVGLPDRHCPLLASGRIFPSGRCVAPILRLYRVQAKMGAVWDGTVAFCRNAQVAQTTGPPCGGPVRLRRAPAYFGQKLRKPVMISALTKSMKNAPTSG